MPAIGWIDPEGLFHDLGQLHTHCAYALTLLPDEGTPWKAGQQLMAAGWIQIAIDSVRTHTPIKGCVLKTAKELLYDQPLVVITALIAPHYVEYSMDYGDFCKKRVIDHRIPRNVTDHYRIPRNY